MTMIRSDTSAPVRFHASSSTVTASTPILKTTTEDIFLFTAAGATATVSTNTSVASRRLSNGEQRSLRLQVPRQQSIRTVTEPRAALPDVKPSVEDPEKPAHRPPKENRPKPVALEKLSLFIESLEGYELKTFIPVVLEPLSDQVFVAEAPDLALSVTGRTIEESVALLKELIVRVYEGNRGRKTLDVVRKRQLKTLEIYIGKTKGTWHWA